MTYTLADYAALTQRLATDQAYRNGLRTKLASTKAGAPLFDSAAFTRGLESLYLNLAEQT